MHALYRLLVHVTGWFALAALAVALGGTAYAGIAAPDAEVVAQIGSVAIPAGYAGSIALAAWGLLWSAGFAFAPRRAKMRTKDAAKLSLLGLRR